jgi:hypothetical protein
MLSRKIVPAAAAVFAAGALLFGTGLFASSPRASAAGAAGTRPAQPARATVPGAVTAARILEIFQTNEALADEQFAGKRVMVTGRMDRIRRLGIAAENRVIYELRMHPAMWTLSLEESGPLAFQISDQFRKQLASVTRDQLVTVEGRFDAGSTRDVGGRINVNFFDARIVRADD